MRATTILSIILVAFSLPAFADEQAELKKATDQFDATYLEGFNKRDPTMMASHWTADAIMVTSTGLKTDVKKIFEGVLKAGFDHADVKTDHIWPLTPDIAIGQGTSHYTGKTASGAPIESLNYWTATYIKQDGTWKIRMLSGFPQAAPAK